MQTIFHNKNRSFVRRPLLWTVPIVLLTVLVFVSVSTLFPGVYGPKANGVNGDKAPAASSVNLTTPTQQTEQISSSTVTPSSQSSAANGAQEQAAGMADFQSQANDTAKKLDDINARLDRSSHRSLDAYRNDIRDAQSAIKDVRQAAQNLKKNRTADTIKQRQAQTLLDDYSVKLSSAIQSYGAWSDSGNPVQYAHAEQQRAAASAAGTLFHSSVDHL